MSARNPRTRSADLPVRQTSIDYMKSFLVIGMILAHAFQLLSVPHGLFWLFSVGINLITFSGFFFCFGYVFYLVYLSRPASFVRIKMAKTAWKTLIAYYISALSSLLLLSPHFANKTFPVTISNLLQIVTLTVIPWYSEFLLAFFLITVLVLVFFDGVNRLLKHPWTLVFLSLLCFATALILPANLLVSNPLALFVGTRTYAVYPIIQYLPIFLVGLYFSKYKIVWNRTAFVLSLVGSGLFCLYYVLNKDLPDRFLPSIYWLMGSSGILYGYFLLSKWLERRAIFFYSLLFIGQKSLLYLLLSNLFLFGLSTLGPIPPPVAFGAGLLIILIINFLCGLISQPVALKTTKQEAVSV